MAAKFLGQYLLEEGLIDRQQLLDALDAQRASNPVLGELAVAAGMLDAEQAERINARQRSQDRRFGDLALEMGLLGAEQVAELLERQRKGRRLFGEILVEQGALTVAQLETALRSHEHERADADRALELGVAAHPAGTVLAGAINTCTRLFPRLLRSHCRFSSLVEAPEGLDGCSLTAQVRVQAERPLRLAVACDDATAARIAGAFLSMPEEECDQALAEDALGELVNVLVGYVTRDALPEDADYRASPPDLGEPASELLARADTLAVSMNSQVGRFVLLVAA